MRAAPTSLDPADRASADSFSRRGVMFLLYDTLVTVDDSGRVQPSLAESWQAARASQRWEFRLRGGIKFHDGTILTADIAAASLRASNPTWIVRAEGNTLAIQPDAPNLELPAELALPRNAIAKRGQQPVGTGPFQIVEWQPGKTLALVANEDYWRGRPFVDGIEIEMGKSVRDQMTAFDLHKADLVEVTPEQSHHFAQDGRRLASSARIELLALLFSKDASSAEEKLLRQALRLSVERGSIRNVLLQGAGDPAGSLLPTSISGYGFVFPSGADLTKARQLRNEVRTVPTWTLGYDSGDPLSRLLAERIALNAKDAGLSLRTATAADSDIRVVRIPIASGDPWIAMSEMLATVGQSAPKNKGGSIEELYSLEQATLASERVIPLFHLPVSYASAAGLKSWGVRMDGSWNLSGAWLETSKP
jgi:ABC-type transport system substrate-binding protein